MRSKTGSSSSRKTLKQIWCTGEDSNLRSSKERQIYSLLPLTTRPPVQSLKLQAFCQRHKTKRASIAPLSKLPNRIKDKPRSEKKSLEWSVRLKSYQVACVYFPCCVEALILELAKGLEPPTL